LLKSRDTKAQNTAISESNQEDAASSVSMLAESVVCWRSSGILKISIMLQKINKEGFAHKKTGWNFASLFSVNSHQTKARKSAVAESNQEDSASSRLIVAESVVCWRSWDVARVLDRLSRKQERARHWKGRF